MRIFCSICKDIFIPYSEVHVTNCGHLYHGSCISTWIKQHKTCPQCRAKTSQPFRVYFDVEKDNNADPSTLEHELEVISDKLREAEREKKALQDDYINVTNIVESMKECALSLNSRNSVLQSSVKALKVQITKLTKQNASVTKLESEVSLYKSKIQTLERIEKIIKGSIEEANKLIESTPVTELAVRQLCTYVAVLKSQLHKIEEKNYKLAKENRDIRKSLAQKVIKDSSEAEEIKNLKETNFKLEQDLQRLKVLYEDSKKKELKNKEEMVTTVKKVTTEIKQKRSFFDFDLDFDDEPNKNSQYISSVKEDKRITQWETLVCAGPSRNVGLFQKSKSFSKSINSSMNEQNLQGSSSAYAYDGMGGRKKIRLGCPTPIEEFEKIKKKKLKKPEQSFQNKKILEYFEIE